MNTVKDKKILLYKDKILRKKVHRKKNENSNGVNYLQPGKGNLN